MTEPDLDGLVCEDDLEAMVAERLADVPHFWSGDHDLLIDHLFTPTRAYEASTDCELVGGTIDLTDYARRLGTHPHHVLIDYRHRWAAYDWAMENLSGGLTVLRSDSVGTHPDNLSSFEWVIVETAGLGLCLTGQISGWLGRDPAQVFFFKDKARATLFKTFASDWLTS